MRHRIRAFVEAAATYICLGCSGTRLSEVARSSKVGGSASATPPAVQISDLEWVCDLAEPAG